MNLIGFYFAGLFCIVGLTINLLYIRRLIYSV